MLQTNWSLLVGKELEMEDCAHMQIEEKAEWFKESESLHPPLSNPNI